MSSEKAAHTTPTTTATAAQPQTPAAKPTIAAAIAMGRISRILSQLGEADYAKVLASLAELK
jgi:hypothetical protein